MRTITAILVLGLTVAASPTKPALAEDVPPAWAYPVSPPGPPGINRPPDDGALRHVPDSTAAFTLSQTLDRFFAPDWHPADHPPMPEIVARGRKPDVFACGFCHRADGPGGPENASLAGLPAEYILQQVADFKSGARKSSVSERVPMRLMISLAQAATNAELEVAAAYFSALTPRPIITVFETDTVPKTQVFRFHLVDMKTGERETLGNRIIEVPEDIDRYLSRDTRSRFISYVPPGGIAKGRALAAGGGEKTGQCAICHGPELKGVGPIPGIAGRSPTYIVRQLYDFQHGARAGSASALMKPIVAKLTIDDMVALAAYAASLAP
jgi:cytochrome c553